MPLTEYILTIPDHCSIGFEASGSLLKLLKVLSFAAIRVSNSWDEFCLQGSIWQCLETFFFLSYNRPDATVM